MDVEYMGEDYGFGGSYGVYGGFDFGDIRNEANMVAEPGVMPGTATVNAEVEVAPVEVGGASGSGGQGATPGGLPLVLGPRIDGANVPVDQERREPVRVKRRFENDYAGKGSNPEGGRQQQGMPLAVKSPSAPNHRRGLIPCLSNSRSL